MTRCYIQQALFPNPPRDLTYYRGMSIGLRTFHIAVTGILMGGHAFNIPTIQLQPVLYLVIASGSAMLALDTYKSLAWIHQGWGLTLMVKFLILLIIPMVWDYRFLLLLIVTIIASVGSHMPGRFRHYSVLYRRNMKEP